MAELKARFQSRVNANLSEIETLTSTDFDRSLGRLIEIAHQLAGLAGSFGYAELSAVAKQVDAYAAEISQVDPHLRSLVLLLQRAMAEVTCDRSR